MTFYLNERYPNRVKNPSDAYPRGSFKNRTAPNSADGTYLEEEWKNDERAFPERILKVAGVTPNGKVDDANSSQVYDALMQIINSMISAGTAPMYAFASGSSDAISATFPRPVQLIDGFEIFVRATYSNATSSPTLAAGDTSAKAIVKGANSPLLIGDISGAGHILHLMYDSRFDRWVLMNPAFGVSQPEAVPVGTICYFGRTGNVAGWLKMDNTEHQRAQYPRLISECPHLIRAGSTPDTFKLIDARGYFLRTLDDGRGIDSNRVIGSEQSDCIRNITAGGLGVNHVTLDVAGGLWGAFYKGAPIPEGKGNGTYGAANVCFDASRVVPVGNENRPKNIAFPLYVKY